MDDDIRAYDLSKNHISKANYSNVSSKHIDKNQ